MPKDARSRCAGVDVRDLLFAFGGWRPPCLAGVLCAWNQSGKWLRVEMLQIVHEWHVVFLVHGQCPCLNVRRVFFRAF